ncbi:MAG: hypothetical protein JSV84_04820 [Gemmatimonadota bacterium]|nr:MAG: hypothetical protein JSV84_04820 [Gemmatimonadota bacterium]
MDTSRDTQSEIQKLKKEVTRLKALAEAREITIGDTLRRRGFTFGNDCPTDNLLYPSRPRSKTIDEYYELLKRYSFRIVLRDIIKYKDGFEKDDLLHYCSAEKVEEYLTFLIKSGIITKKTAQRYTVSKKNLDSFGGTLEWLVAQIFRREFCSIASWGVKVLNTHLGGDYDVIARVEQKLVYLETKSSPPKNIHQETIDEFLGRLEDLKPNLAIYLVDTHLRMEDKITKMFRWGLMAKYPVFKKRKKLVKRIYGRIFLVPGNIMIINSKPDLVKNLADCLKYFFGVIDQQTLR